MAIFNSSSLAFSDHNNDRHDNGLVKNTKTRISKQHLVEHKMFGSKRKNIQIGKKFRKSGKGVMHGAVSPKMSKPSGVSPSVAEFDKMMNSIAGGDSKSKKRLGISRKQFG